MQLDVTDLPPALANEAQQAWQHILERAGSPLAARLEAAVEAAGTGSELARVLACSPFVADQLRSKGELLCQLFASGQLHASLAQDFFLDDLRRRLDTDGCELQQGLRQFRQWHMLRIVWRDFCRLADTLETVRDTSLLAEAAIAEALVRVQSELEPRFGEPIGRDSGERQQLVVLAMGKLGARELNVSSDIDLVFAFPEAGETRGGERVLSNEEFFTRVGRGLINALDQVTADGFVFRVDMRLRPYGESGALVHSFSALEAYYQDQGRDWERYALIKARPVTGSAESARELMAMLRPFVFRKYVDYGVIESLRGMKQMISAEVRRRGLENNVKLGHGGIREVEFIAQCFQLIRGGRDLGLQQRELLPVLRECAALGMLPAAAVEELTRAYLFLRDSEHGIQGYQDRQTQELPTDERAQQALATVMGCEHWQAYLARLDQHRAIVAGHFGALIAPAEEEPEGPEPAPPWDESLGVDALAQLGFRDPGASLELLDSLRHNGRVVTLQVAGRERLEQFMPLLLGACAEAPDPDMSLARVLPLVLAVVRRSAYLVLLMENPPALVELVALCGASPWIAQQMAR
ncbi:MAG: bifunctional [glutamate--ammonia ligase]-adenylyl-L-tyrosine phosphorylase/[glutamate--ammonia-ligase] adenylyltransferase, partial [Halioglobus sp.]|nr:bifunctional [glutamate--ammonia ligase]-adenylyl-L-tyrosine phosphorylase/[glutamate--ammonia-ligase] adenylyltransferase [Halioglobus sp.]